MQFQSPDDIYAWMQSFILTPPKKFGSFGLERTKYLASLVDNPQDDYPVIHIAGTSGKGSTARMTAQILQAHNYRAGLHVSPHLLDRRERVQIDNIFADDTILLEAAKKLSVAVEQCSDSEYGSPSYYEAMMVLAYLSFSLAKVDVAVVEVGCGGLYDGSNIITRKDKISVITRQGYDHQDIVGETLQEIAENDVGIILPSSQVVALEQDEEICNLIIQQAAEKQIATLYTVTSKPQSGMRSIEENKQTYYSNIHLKNDETVFDYTDSDGQEIMDIHLSLVGLFQAENAALALMAAQLFCEKHNVVFDYIRAQQGLLTPGFAGRYDIHAIHGSTVILDGAHNPQKMQALIDTLKHNYPEKKKVRYISFKQGKHREEMLDIMMTIPGRFVLGSFSDSQDMPLYSVDTTFVLNYLKEQQARVQDYTLPENFLASTQDTIDSDEIVVITGSLYRLSRVYEDIL